MKKIEAEDPFEPRLKSLAKDVSKEGLTEAWTLQIIGDKSSYLSQDLKSERNSGIITIKS